MNLSKSVEEAREWISKKQLLDLYSESEAEELVDIGSIEVRKHPDNPRQLASYTVIFNLVSSGCMPNLSRQFSS